MSNIFRNIKNWIVNKFSKPKPKFDFTGSAQSFANYYQTVYPIDLGTSETIRLLKNGDPVVGDNNRQFRMPDKNQIGLTLDENGNVTGKTEL